MAQSLGRSFLTMFSGTLVSRILGMVRAIVLVAALGTMGQADAFNAASALPQTIYNLLAGGVLNAVLVPQIVRAMRRKDNAFTNRLLTLAATILLVATVILTAAAALIVLLYSGAMAPEWRALAVAFALWCIPEVFFYGLYTLFGNVLNARGSFGPYMWAPVVNNVVAISGLFVYMAIYGAVSSSGGKPGDWDSGRIALVGGIALFGVVAQSLVLIPALRRSGYRFRLDFRFKGAGLGAASTMAKWTFAALAVGQIGFLIVSNVAGAANGVADSLRVAGDASYLTIPTITSYTNAFATFMLPQSLITTSLVTAIFTSMSARAAVGDASGVRSEMSQAVRMLGVFTMFAMVAFTVLSVPLMQTLFMTAPPEAARGFAAVLAALALGIPAQAIWTVVQRVFYAFEDAKTLFRIQIPVTAVVAGIGLLSLVALPPSWWVVGASFGSTVSLYVGGVIGFVAMRLKIPSLDGARILRTYLRLLLAALPTAVFGWVALHFWGPVSVGGGLARFGMAAAKLIVLGLAMTVVYLALVRALRVEELDLILEPFKRLLGRLRGGLTAEQAAQRGASSAIALPPGTPPPPPPPPSDMRHLTAETGVNIPVITDSFRPGISPNSAHSFPARMEGLMGSDDGREDAVPVLQAGEVFARRFTLLSPIATFPTGGEVWKARDNVLVRLVTVVALPEDGSSTSAEFLDAARRASLVEDTRFARLVDIGRFERLGTRWAYVVSENPAGTQLSRLEGQLSADQARAVVGETAAALESARRRGVQHGALSASLIRVSRAGVVVCGLAYMAVARGVGRGYGNPLEASRGRAEVDARALSHLAAVLSGGKLAAPHGNDSRAIMESLSPWVAISLPPDEKVPTRPVLDVETEFEEVQDEAVSAAPAAPSDAVPLAPPLLAAAPPAAAPPAAALPPAVPPPVPPTALAAAALAPAPRLWNPRRWKLRPPARPLESAPQHYPDIFAGLDPTQLPQRAAAHAAADTSFGSALRPEAPALPAVAPISAPPVPAALPPAAATPAPPPPPPPPAGVVGRIDSLAGRLGVHIPGEVADTQNAQLPLSRRRLDPGPFVLAVIVILLIVLLGLAIGNITGIKKPSTRMLQGHGSAGISKDYQPGSTTKPPAETSPASAPKIASIGIVDPPPGDGQENPELTGRAFDGDPGSFWRSRSYTNPNFGIKKGVGLEIVLTASATVREIRLSLLGEGGHVQVLQDPGSVNDPNRKILASADMGRDTVLSLPESTKLQRVVLWFTSLPRADSDGKNRVELAEVTVR